MKPATPRATKSRHLANPYSTVITAFASRFAREEAPTFFGRIRDTSTASVELRWDY